MLYNRRLRYYVCVLTLFIIFLKCKGLNSNYQQSKCGFRSQNYSLEWAYEPLSLSVVFVLKVKSLTQLSENTESKEKENKQKYSYNFTSGIGFEKKNISIIDFIQISVNGNEASIIDSYLDKEKEIKKDSLKNIQIISIDVDDNNIVAKFARKMISKDKEHDVNLDDCIIFKIPSEVTKKKSKFFFKSFKKFEVCNIEKYCTIDFEFPKLKDKTKLKSLRKFSTAEINSELKEKNNSPNYSIDNIEVAHSVDISGTGDPCSFIGPNHYYTFNWSYNRESDCVDFIMRHPVKKGKWWSAVGIGDNMSEMDIGIIFLENGKAKKMIDYFSNSYNTPDKDDEQNWILHRSKSKIVKIKWNNEEKNILELQFSRLIETKDSEKDRTMDNCVLFQFAANSGSYGPNFSVQKHKDWPDLYKACDLKEKCLQDKSYQHTHNKRENLNINNSKNFEISSNIDNIVYNTSEKTTKKDDIISLLTETSSVPTLFLITNNSDSSVINNIKDETTISSSSISKSLTDVELLSTATTNNILIEISDPPTILTLIGDFNNKGTNELNNSTESGPNNINNKENLNEDENKKDDVKENVLNLSFNETNTSFKPDENLEKELSSTSSISLIQSLRELLTNKNLSITEIPNINFKKNITESSLLVSKSTEALTTIPTHLSTPKDDSNKTSTVLPFQKETDLSKSNFHNVSTKLFELTTTTIISNEISQTNGSDKKNTDKELFSTHIIPLENSLTENENKKKENLTITEFVNNKQENLFFTTITSLKTITNTIEETGIPEGETENEINSTFPSPTTTTNMLITSSNELNSKSFQKVNFVETTTIVNVSTSNEIQQGCNEQKSDLEVCNKYMTNYFNQVKEWADKHNEEMENQFGKACKLLSAVPHVPTFCCKIFEEKCKNHL